MNDEDGEERKRVRPTKTGVVYGLASLPILAATHIFLGFPAMAIHVLLYPIFIALLVRFYLTENKTNPWRRR